MALEVFKLFGSVFVDTDKAEKSIHKVDKKAGNMANTLANGIKSFAKFGAIAGAGATAAVAGVTKLATSAAETADRVDKLSAKAGMSKKAFQEWDYIMSQNGMDVEKMQVGMKTLVNQMDAAAKGSASAQGAFDALGISIEDSNGELKSQEQMMNEAIAALAGMEDGAKRAKLASQLFGKAGQEMAPMLNTGTKGIKELRDRAHELGLVMSDEAVDAGVVLGDTMDDVKSSFGMLVTQLGVKVMPVVQKALDFTIKKLPDIQKAVKKVEPYVEKFFNFLVKNFPKVQKAFSTAVTKISEFWQEKGKPAFDAIVNGAKTAVDIFQEHWPKIQETAQNVFGYIKQFWEEHLKPTFDAIVNFVQNVLWPIWQEVFEHYILPSVQNLFNTIKNLWENSLKPVFTAIVDFVGNVFSGNFTGAFENILTVLRGIWDGLVILIKNPINQVISIVNTFVGGIIEKINGLIEKINSVSVDVPGWVADMTGMESFGFNIPKIPADAEIPLLAKGGSVYKGGRAIINEDGPELVELPTGAKVTPLNSNNNAFAKMEKLMAQLVELMAEVNMNMPKQVVLDTGATVGYLARPMDKALGNIAKSKKRGGN